VVRHDRTDRPTQASRESTYNLDQIVEALGDDELKAGELLERVAEKTGMGPSTFHNLLRKGCAEKRLHKSKINEKWSTFQ